MHTIPWHKNKILIIPYCLSTAQFSLPIILYQYIRSGSSSFCPRTESLPLKAPAPPCSSACLEAVRVVYCISNCHILLLIKE